MPVDLKEINVRPGKGEAIIVTVEGRAIKGTIVGDAHEGGYLTGYVSHFATCPAAGQYRRVLIIHKNIDKHSHKC